MKKILLSLFLVSGISQSNYLVAQTNTCAGAPALPVNISCINTAYNVPNAFGTEIAAPSCHASQRDGWFTFTATSNSTTISASTNQNLGIAVYTGVCGVLVEAACVNAGGNGVSETLTFATVPGVTYHIRLSRVNGGASATSGNICVYDTNPSTCGATFTDTGGAGANYSSSTNQVVTICPSVPGQCVTATFTAFNLEAEFDFLYIYDDNTTTATALMSAFHGTTVPGMVSATSNNASGCLTFNFISDGSVTRAGWQITIGCQACPTPSAPGASSQDCNGSPTVCGSNSFAGNSSGSGSTADINGVNRGCLLSGENQSSWYYFSPSANGNLEFTIAPTNGTDDYDFAIWGPYATVTCPPDMAPVRCSYAAGGGNTGTYNGAGDNSENAFGDRWVEDLPVLAGEIYVMVIDNFSATASPFTLGWNASSGAALDCTALPIELISFRGQPLETKIMLMWGTMSETNNDYFTIEKSDDGVHFYEIGRVAGAINSNVLTEYNFYDEHPHTGINYYRLKQTDLDGKSTTTQMIAVDFAPRLIYAGNAYPNPTNDDFTIDVFSENETGIVIEVYDVTGKLLFTESKITLKGVTRCPLAMEAYEKGMYSVRIYEAVSKQSISAQLLVKH